MTRQDPTRNRLVLEGEVNAFFPDPGPGQGSVYVNKGNGFFDPHDLALEIVVAFEGYTSTTSNYNLGRLRITVERLEEPTSQPHDPSERGSSRTEGGKDDARE